MKKKIAILGSTGSIGRTLIEIIKKDKKNFDIILLTADKNYQKLYNQALILNVKNLIITVKKSFKILCKKTKNLNIKIFNNFENFENIFKKKIDYVMSSIIGINGLLPTLKVIKFTKNIAIANKESIICGWNLIKNRLEKYKTKFIPVDSEHFSIWYGLANNNSKIDKLFITASGGPFYKLPLSKFKYIKINQALKHPNWKMGNKISIDSSTMINKVFEIIEAKNIFNLKYDNIDILVHPQSYVHALIKFKDGLIKIIAHDTTMKIPIANSLLSDNKKFLFTKKIDIDKLNNLDFKKINKKKFPMVNLLKQLPDNQSLFETVIVSANDALVNLFLNKKINFTDINKILFKLINLNEFNKYKKLKPNSVEDILKLNKYVNFKINQLSI